MLFRSDRLESSAARIADRALAHVADASERLSRRPEQLLAAATARLDSSAAQVRAYDPVHALARRWPPTRRAAGGAGPTESIIMSSTIGQKGPSLWTFSLPLFVEWWNTWLRDQTGRCASN